MDVGDTEFVQEPNVRIGREGLGLEEGPWGCSWKDACSPWAGRAGQRFQDLELLKRFFGWISAIKPYSKESRAIRAGGHNLKEILSVGEEVAFQANP